MAASGEQVPPPAGEEAGYFSESFPHVVIFDFFMPLANEASLRTALDSLFYRDAIEAKLGEIPPASLDRVFGAVPGEDPAARIQRICDWISARFVGYSLTHAGGRYRAGELRRAAEIFREANPADAHYIVDETTAVVRFVFPVGEPIGNRFLPSEEYIGRILEHADEKDLREEANKVRWTFYTLFVRTVIHLIEGEDEIWLLESGYANRLHKWVKK